MQAQRASTADMQAVGVSRAGLQHRLAHRHRRGETASLMRDNARVLPLAAADASWRQFTGRRWAVSYRASRRSRAKQLYSIPAPAVAGVAPLPKPSSAKGLEFLTHQPIERVAAAAAEENGGTEQPQQQGIFDAAVGPEVAEFPV